MFHLQAEKLTKTFVLNGEVIHAVRDVSLAIPQGEFVSIIGHSGSGKTTLLSMLGTLITPTSGRLFIDGKDMYALTQDELADERCKMFGFMFQFSSLLTALTSLENVLLPIIFKAKSACKKDIELAEGLLEMVGLADKKNAYPWQLSGGQQRRVAIARAFINKPSIILADEPTGDLDEQTEFEMLDFFKRMNTQNKITFILVTHNTDLASTATLKYKMHSGIISIA